MEVFFFKTHGGQERRKRIRTEMWGCFKQPSALMLIHWVPWGKRGVYFSGKRTPHCGNSLAFEVGEPSLFVGPSAKGERDISSTEMESVLGKRVTFVVFCEKKRRTTGVWRREMQTK